MKIETKAISSLLFTNQPSELVGRLGNFTRVGLGQDTVRASIRALAKVSASLI